MAQAKTQAERIALKVRRKQRLVRVALGQEKADLVLKNADYINVFTGEICHGDIAVANGLVVGMDGQYEGVTEVDVSGRIVAPGFIDAHIHLESSLVSPASFARAVVPHGTTTVICDPHEIANVCGTDGMDYMIAATEGLPLDVHFMLPSCVPATPMEESGAALSWRDINAYFDHPRVLGLAEMMNYPGILMGDRKTIEKIVVSQAYHKKIDGHAPGLSGKALNAYMSAGVYSDHECDTLENALEKLRKGQFIMIREGTAAQNLEALLPLLTPQYAHRCMFATDDKHPGDLLDKGHIDYIVRKAIRLGADPILTIIVASHYAARYFLLNNKGAISPGYLADFVVLDDLKNVNVEMVFKRGRLVYDGGAVAMEEPAIDPDILGGVTGTVHMPPLTAEQLALGDAPLIGLIPGQIVTEDLGRAQGVDTAQDVVKMTVCERHHHTGHVASCYVRGYGLRCGAVATSVAHDSHNIIACGVNDVDMALAVNRLRELGGGMAVAEDGRIVAELALPVAGLVTDRPLEEVNAALERCKAAAVERGTQPGIDPFMTMSFASLPVIPTLRLTTRGVIDVNTQTIIE
ncbi:MAG: adenine deaminase [Clostridiales bacterium]|nr:adenine deaminase [Clostridiales bacterium]